MPPLPPKGGLACPAPAGDTSPLSEIWKDETLRSWPPLAWPADPIRPAAPSRSAVWQVRGLVVLGVLSLISFFVWLLDPEKRGDAWLFWLLTASMAYRSLWWLVEWANYARPKFEPFAAPRREWTVDVLTTACPGEPRGMILRTLLAMKAIEYPHTDYLCDEGNDPTLKAACEALGIRHVTRVEKRDAKAGNINNALAQAGGEIAIVLDPDHEPSPYMIHRVLGYFEDPKVGFVQSVQAYRNQKDGFVADGAAKQTYLFYGPVMIGMHAYGTTQAIGANCAFRRAALDSIGGHAAGLSEDMHTTMRLYARGWRSVYVPEILTRGLVPSTLSAYCKQQVKWACGSVELLLHVYPRLFFGLTSWQRLHYFLAPLYFLRGFFGALDLLIPIACLAFGGVVLRIDLAGYLAAFLPVLILSTVIRQRTQKWTIEPSEHGVHLMGGILAAGCWWVFLRGVLCACLQIRLPYIPTPKDHEAVDHWSLAMPNLLAAGASLAAIGYGLNRDWTPFNLMMAAFALWNAAQLTFVAMLGQQRTLQRLGYALCRRDWIGRIWWPIEHARFQVHCALVRLMRERPAYIALAVVVMALAGHFCPRAADPETELPRWKETGGFYLGLQNAEETPAAFPAAFGRAERKLGAELRLFPLTRRWGPEETVPFPLAMLREARRHGAVPLLTWEPSAAAFPDLAGDAELHADRHLCAAITNGDFDRYLTRFAAQVREFGEPILIRLAPQADNPAMPWSSTGGNTSEEYINAWNYVVAIFNDAGATNAGWVWQPATVAGFATHFPGVTNVDWIGCSMLSRGGTGGGAGPEFAGMYHPFQQKAEALRLPVMLTQFGSTGPAADRRGWLSRALAQIAGHCPEIKGLVLPGSASGWFADESEETGALLRTELSRPRFQEKAPAPARAPGRGLWAERSRPATHSPAVRGGAGKFELLTLDRPFYVRGVAYNPDHDWRDGYMALTRRELEQDFTRLHELGANTIRRYGGGWYDRNILRIASEKDLRVLYGFWFEQQVDFRTETAKLDGYQAEVERTVRQWKGEPSVLAWSLGNEVWGLLKHRYAQPYLTEVRHAHVDFVERLARRIHELDPQHPVFVAHEHSPQLAGTLADFARGAPSIDFTAVNSYYEHRLSDLQRITHEFDPSRPYLVSEFGPDGYWETSMARHDAAGAIVEPSSSEKVHSYQRAWALHTESHRGANLGGVAYCWRDRLEETATWFGMTDSTGQPKPTAWALQQLWTEERHQMGPIVLDLSGAPATTEPGSVVQLHARVRAPHSGALTYRWRLTSEAFEVQRGAVKPEADGQTAQITLPRAPGVYRAYLEVSDGHSADEANFPLTVAPAGALTKNSPLKSTPPERARHLVVR